MTLPRGIRNRNPGNIRKAPHFQWQGELRLANTDKRYDAEFCVFEEVEYGIRALMKLLINYNQKWEIKTIKGAIDRWAPPIENNTSAYVKAVEKQTGIPANQEWDFTKFEFLVPVTRAIIRHENGAPWNHFKDYIERGYTDDWYSDRVYQDAYELAVKGRLVTHTMNKLPETFVPPKKPTFLQKLFNKLKGK